jgi:hypothetical protein
MQKTLSATLGAQGGFPAGSVVTYYRLGATAAGGTLQYTDIPAGDPLVKTMNLSAGGYTAYAQALNAAKSGLGNAVTSTFTVDADTTITLQVPVSVTAA